MRLSTTVFSFGFAVWFAFSVLAYSLPGVLVHLALAALLLGALARTAAKVAAPLPYPRIPFTRESLQQGATALGGALGAAVERANALLGWADARAAGRALAYAALAYASVWAVSAGALLTLWVAAFALVPLYERFPAPVDAAAAAAAAACKRAAGALDKGAAAASAFVTAPLGLAKLIAGCSVLAYLLWDVLPSLRALALRAWRRHAPQAQCCAFLPPLPPSHPPTVYFLPPPPPFH